MVLNELERILAQLYSTSEAARLVTDHVGIPHTFIDFDGPIGAVWHRIVEQADKRQKVPDLLRKAISDYPQRIELQRMFGAFLYGTREPKGNEAEQDKYTYSHDMPDTATLIRFIRSVEELEQIINGSERLRLPALKDIVYNLDKNMPMVRAQVDNINAQLDKIEQRQRIRNLLMWGIAAGLFLLALTVLILASRQGVW